MSTSIYYIIFSVILILALVFTFLIGNSKQNKEGNPEYDNRTKGNWSRLTLFYVIAIALGVLALIVYIVKTTKA
jgi:fucose permease